MEKSIAIITARGGSKRIPKKNIKEFCGKPIIAYSIEAAIDSGMFDEVMVSTDSEEIASIAKQYGAKVPFMRSKKTSDDFATTADVLMEVLQEYEKNGERFSYMCCIYPTAPFVTGEKLTKAMNEIKEQDAVMAIPVVAFSYPPQRCYVLDDNGNIEYKYKQYAQTRSQDLEKQYHDAGQFYVYNIEKFLELGGKIVENVRPIFVSELEVQDIDNEDDWKIAELKFNAMQEKNK
ncbi:MAG: pseudaminic acid cytidylyltransferase [Lachnospiraceae bacterium]|nr:pseudaminic acid cytidylyltransferase [Lachnospiraceae bacterium]